MKIIKTVDFSINDISLYVECKDARELNEARHQVNNFKQVDGFDVSVDQSVVRIAASINTVNAAVINSIANNLERCVIDNINALIQG